MKLENVSCGLCGSSDSEHVFDVANTRLKVTDQIFALRRCRVCGLMYTSPRPVVEDMEPFYDDRYYRFATHPFLERLNLFFSRERVNYVQRWKKHGEILDVGCGSGDFLLQMEKEGFGIHGIEPSDKALDTMPETLRGKVEFGPLDKVSWGESSLNLATLWHVLEHLPKPVEALQKIRGWLQPEGILIVEVPNAGSLEARWLREHWFALDVPRHFWHFTPQTLRAIAERAGFRKISVEASAWSKPSLIWTYALSNGPGLERWARQHVTLGNKTLIQKLAKYGGLPLCLILRWISLPTMRLVARP